MTDFRAKYRPRPRRLGGALLLAPLRGAGRAVDDGALLWICLGLPSGTGLGPSRVGLIRSLSAQGRDPSQSCHAVSLSQAGHR